MKELTQELTVCDIIGHFGLYQWSLTLFAAIYSSLPSLTVVIGPIWTPDLAHLCASDYYLPGNNHSSLTTGRQVNFSAKPHQCFSELDGKACSSFIYDDADHGTILTNTVSNPLPPRKSHDRFIWSAGSIEPTQAACVLVQQ